MLEAFTAGLLLITISELGDKTFFIAMILAMRHSRRFVMVGVVAALAVMTILSVLIGQVVALVPQQYVKLVEIILFLVFGLKLVYDASRMKPSPDACEEEEEALEVVNNAETSTRWQRGWMGIVGQAFALTFIAEWGDRTQIATIALAAGNNPIGVSLGAILGHSICAAIAVLGGRLICRHISEKMVTLLGGLLFLVFAGVAGVDAIAHSSI
jgi:putative Ca2+/H+ antiporter (TMEM165/GDT1 family)